jgi:hypothetical protein
VKQLYKKEGAEIGPVVGMVKFAPGEEQVTLDTSDETWIKDGWSLCPLRLLCITKEELDDYDGGLPVPVFQMQLKMTPSFSPKALEQRVGFVGITPKNSFITITKEPMFEGMCLSSYKSFSTNSLILFQL